MVVGHVQADMFTQHTTSRAAAFALTTAALFAVSSCTGSPAPPERDDPRDDIDARAYYESYESGGDEDWSLSSLLGSSSADYSAGTGAVEEAAVSDERPPGLLENNTSVDAGASDFVDTRSDALSTFALDVDTGSYSVGRTLLQQGHLPPPASIRPEEWVNAFEYGDRPPAESDLAVQVDPGLAPTLSDGTQLIRVGVQAREVTEQDRPPVALTLVVDTSGSMDIRERLGLVKSSLALLAKHPRPDDTIAVVTYEDNAKPLLEPTPVSDTETILGAIDGLRPGGSTNLEAGLRLGYKKAREAYRDDAINAVVLASDGVANVGTTGPHAITKRIAEAGAEGIHLVTVGYGMGNYNDHLMEQLADQGDGFYSYVDTFAEAERLFVTDLSGTLTTVAYDAKVQVEFDPAAVASYRLIGYDNRAIADEDFESDDVDAGEIGAGHDVTALYEVQPAEGAEPGTEVGAVTVRWQSEATGQIEEQAVALAVADPSAEPTDQLALASTVADFAQFLKGAEPVRERGVTLDQLAHRAGALQAQGVDGAVELSRLIELAQRVR